MVTAHPRLELNEAAERAGVSPQAVLGWLSRQEVEGEQSRWGIWTIDPDSVDRNIQRLRNPICKRCGESWQTEIGPGRRPTLCPSCKRGR